MRIAALAPSLARGERRVAEAIATDVQRAVDMTAQELAEAVGVGRASVIRTAQTLGYDGYPQLRVALAREKAFGAAAPAAAEGSLGVVRAAVDRFARALPHTAGAVTEDAVEAFVAALDQAPRVVIAASGLSAPLGYDFAMRLTSAGRPAEFLPDTLAQHIGARQLVAGDVLLTISGSGANAATLHAADAARDAGATVLALTAFARSPLVSRATTVLVVPPVTGSFQDELMQTSRAAFALVIEALVEALVVRRGPRGRGAREATLAVVSESLGE
ncbi:MurR/RpiR family transcriptional regulator [Demequina sp. SYSU T00192]|uniref:MurR/RpiR family transcriptional regulator n=1 Tax=Demequina litoralis TaxID=3051660 RepID=A0ABT8GBX9_9MICO|nr:MurR/RpiR family transcriptional regulator [Demequina sp. SYSU T00192]MDN4476482.1 MurR/RpiR family transcriptional regulator [Demequina sp. SYSU T00192]